MVRMGSQKTGRGAGPRWNGTRGMTMTMGLVVMIVVLLIVGTGGYFAFNSVKSSRTTSTSCAPSSSLTCLALQPTHDVTLFTPFKSAQTGTPIPFTASLKESAKNYTFNFGDGSPPVTAPQPTASHSYSEPGCYIISVQANVGGTLHDNDLDLAILTISASYATAGAGDAAPLAGTIVSNSSPTALVPPSAILQPGGSVTAHGAYTGQPTNPLFVLQPPKMVVASGGRILANATASSNATAQVSFPNPGVFWVTYVGSATSGGETAYLNYTWTVFVAPSGLHASAGPASYSVSPHPGTLNWYELSNGARSVDPSIAYDPAQRGAGQQRLPAAHLVQRVPGGAGSAGLHADAHGVRPREPPMHGPLRHRPDRPGHGCLHVRAERRAPVLRPRPPLGDLGGLPVGRPVHVLPNDGVRGPAQGDVEPRLDRVPVAASLREPRVGRQDALPLQQHPAVGSGEHARQRERLLPVGRHPERFVPRLRHVPGERGRPIVAGLPRVRRGLRRRRDRVVRLVQRRLAGRRIPYWTLGNISGAGDRPCLLPGGGKTTDAASFQSWKGSTPANGWDTWETDGSSAPYIGGTQFAMAGSGPYYLANLVPGQGYMLRANPNYAPDPFCLSASCDPTARGTRGTSR